MSELSLSESERAALVFRLALEPGADPDYKHVDALPSFEHKRLYHRLLGVGTDRKERWYRLETDCVSLGGAWLEFPEQVRRSNPALDLDQVGVKDTWHFEGFEAIYQEQPPLVHILDPVFARPSVSMIYGSPKSMKSLLTLDGALAVASGRTWLPGARDGLGGFAALQTPVLWCDAENGRRRVIERAAAFGKSYELPGDTPFFFVSMPVPMLRANRKEDIGTMLLRIKAYGAGMLVVDHFSQCLDNVDENSSAMAEIMANLRTLAELGNVALVLIHHVVKYASKYGTGGESLRGHGSIMAGLDLALLVERSEEVKNQVRIRPTAVRGADLEQIGAFFTYAHKAGSKELETCQFSGCVLEANEEIAERKILVVVEDNPGINQNILRGKVKKMTGIGDNTIRSVIGQLENQGKIRWEKGDKGAHLYYLAEPEEFEQL